MENSKSAKLGLVPIKKLLFEMSMPAIFSMMVMSLYNIVDSIFVAKYNPLAIESLSIVFPIQILCLALALGIGIGTKSNVSRLLGAKKNEEASTVAKSGLILSVIGSIIYTILIISLAESFISKYSNNEEIKSMALQYILIVSGFSFCVIVEILFSKTLQATGNMKAAMVAQLIGAITNIILDPILIFGYLGFPKMGVQGAAIATGISQLCAMIYSCSRFIFKKQDISFNYKGFKFKFKNIKGIIGVGIPVAAINALASLTIMILNAILMVYQYAMAILGIYFKLQSFVFMPMFGVMQGSMPIFSYNYGAKNKERFKECFILAFKIVLMILGMGTVLFLALPELLMKLFNADGIFLTEGAFALRIMSLAFIMAAVNTLFSSTLQSIGKGATSLIMSLARQLIFVAIFAKVLSSIFGLRGIWFAYPIAELLTLLIFTPISLKILKSKLDFPILNNELEESSPVQIIEPGEM